MPAITFLFGNCRVVQALDLIPGKRDRAIKIPNRAIEPHLFSVAAKCDLKKELYPHPMNNSTVTS